MNVKNEKEYLNLASNQPELFKKRGRRPISLTGNITNLDHKKLAKLKEAKKRGLNVVYIGNKLVDKSSPEYKEKRAKNRELNRIWKQRVKKEQQEKEAKLADLEKENKKLEQTIVRLRELVNEKRDQILKLNNKQLPENINSMFDLLDKMDEKGSEYS